MASQASRSDLRTIEVSELIQPADARESKAKDRVFTT